MVRSPPHRYGGGVWWFLLGLMVGATLGVLVAGLMAAAKQADEHPQPPPPDA